VVFKVCYYFYLKCVEIGVDCGKLLGKYVFGSLYRRSLMVLIILIYIYIYIFGFYSPCEVVVGVGNVSISILTSELLQTARGVEVSW
jgi:hypothetical protein